MIRIFLKSVHHTLAPLSSKGQGVNSCYPLPGHYCSLSSMLEEAAFLRPKDGFVPENGLFDSKKNAHVHIGVLTLVDPWRIVENCLHIHMLILDCPDVAGQVSYPCVGHVKLTWPLLALKWKSTQKCTQEKELFP